MQEKHLSAQPRTVYTGRLFDVLLDEIVYQNETDVGRITIEYVQRPPGVRVIACKEDDILLTQEYRTELAGWDYRLPGGKVANTNREYSQLLDCMKQNHPLDAEIYAAHESAQRELIEEAQLSSSQLNFFHKSIAGASVNWDLYYFVATQLKSDTSLMRSIDELIHVSWHTRAEVLQKCLRGEIHEDRTSAVLMRFLLGEHKYELTKVP